MDLIIKKFRNQYHEHNLKIEVVELRSIRILGILLKIII